MCEGGEGGIREGRRSMRGIDSCILRGRRIWSIGTELVNSGIYSAPGLRRFWARRARTSIDVLGLGVLVGRVAGFGVS
jgi:hypothetical protein